MFGSWTLAEEYGFRDADGRQPDWGVHLQQVVAPYKTLDEDFYQYWEGYQELMEMAEGIDHLDAA